MRNGRGGRKPKILEVEAVAKHGVKYENGC